MEIVIQNRETVAQDRNRWKEVCVAVMDFKSFCETGEED